MACKTAEMLLCKYFWLCEVNINELNSVLPSTEIITVPASP